jgi:hypothetical protein
MRYATQRIGDFLVHVTSDICQYLIYRHTAFYMRSKGIQSCVQTFTDEYRVTLNYEGLVNPLDKIGL